MYVKLLSSFSIRTTFVFSDQIVRWPSQSSFRNDWLLYVTHCLDFCIGYLLLLQVNTKRTIKNCTGGMFIVPLFFYHCRKLRKPRVTRIHMNLFASMILQCLVRLVIYADQIIVRQKKEENHENRENSSENTKDEVWGIDNTVSFLKAEKCRPYIVFNIFLRKSFEAFRVLWRKTNDVNFPRKQFCRQVKRVLKIESVLPEKAKSCYAL